jgi:hypothetical protein
MDQCREARAKDDTDDDDLKGVKPGKELASDGESEQDSPFDDEQRF